MPRTSPVSSVLISGISGGVNRDSDPAQLDVRQSPDALNVNFGPAGAISSRNGFARYDLACNHDARGLYTFHVTGGSEYVISACEAGDIYAGAYGVALADSTHDFAAASTEYDFHVAFGTLNNILYMTSLSAQPTGSGLYPLSFTGAVWAHLTPADFTGDAEAPAFPVARHLCTHHDRMWAANVIDSAVRLPSRVHFSNALVPTNWPASQYIDFDPNDGSEITALQPFGQALLVFKQHAVHLLTGKSEESFTRYAVETRVGTSCPGGVAVAGGICYFFDPNTGVWTFDGASFEPIDQSIRKYILTGINHTYIYRAQAWMWKDRFYLSVPWGGTAYPSHTFVFETVSKSWTEYDYGVQSATIAGNNILLGGGTAGLEHVAPDPALGAYENHGVYTLETGHYDEHTPAPSRTGRAIYSYVYTPWILPEQVPFVKHRTVRVDMVWTALGDVNVHVESFRDYMTTYPTVTQTINTSPGGMIWGTATWGAPTVWGGAFGEVLTRTTGWGGHRWRALQFKFSVDGTDEQMQLNNLLLVFSSLSRVRGEL